MTNLKWHADQLNKISKSMKGSGGRSRSVDIGAADDGTGPDIVKRSRPNQLLRKLRNAQRHRQTEIARPAKEAPAEPAEKDPPQPLSQWSQRGTMLALVPLSIVGMATLFVLGFIGSREVVGVIVGDDYLPQKTAASNEIAAPSIASVPREAPASANTKVDVAHERDEPDRRVSIAAPVTDSPDPEETASTTATTRAPQEPASATPQPETQTAADETGRAAPVFALPADAEPPLQDADVPPAFADVPAETTRVVPVETTSVETEAPSVKDAAELKPKASVAEAQPEVAADPAVAGEPEVAPQTVAAKVQERVPTETEETAAPPAQASTTEANLNTPAVTAVATAEAEEPHTRRDNDDQTDELNKKAQAAEETGPAEDAAPADVAQLIGQGHTLMASGKITEARKLFTQSLSSGSAEAALALGRSYDPKFLATLRSPDAQAEPAEARRWYEEWYRLSVEQGAISANVRLERLLQAMNLN